MWFFNPESRGFMNYVKENMKGNLVGVEVGVAEGLHAFKYLRMNKNIKKVWLVDPYLEYEMNGEKLSYKKYKKEAKKRLSIFKDRIVWLKMNSVQASRRVEEESLDFAYIDANHSYESVLTDIITWYPKIKKGGVLGGHDFSGSFPGVAKAVIEFTETHDIEIHGRGSDWWIKK